MDTQSLRELSSSSAIIILCLLFAPQNIRLIIIYHDKCPHYHGYSRPPGDECPCNCGFMELTMSSARVTLETPDLFVNNVNNFDKTFA